MHDKHSDAAIFKSKNFLSTMLKNIQNSSVNRDLFHVLKKSFFCLLLPHFKKCN